MAGFKTSGPVRTCRTKYTSTAKIPVSFQWSQTGSISLTVSFSVLPNPKAHAVSIGITFSPDGRYAYIADTGVSQGTRFPADPTLPATIYRFDVASNGIWQNRVTFAYVTPGNPDGVHCDSNGYVYAGCGDGLQVWNPAGKLIGKIFLGGVSANFAVSRIWIQ